MHVPVPNFLGLIDTHAPPKGSDRVRFCLCTACYRVFGHTGSAFWLYLDEGGDSLGVGAPPSTVAGNLLSHSTIRTLLNGTTGKQTMLRLQQHAGRRIAAAVVGSPAFRAVSSSATTPAPQQDLKLKSSAKGVSEEGPRGKYGLGIGDTERSAK